MTIVDANRRTEILDVAAELIATKGIRTSLQEIADACGIRAGSLYHHFESKEAILIELVERFVEALDRAASELDDRSSDRDPMERVYEFADAVAATGIRHRAALLMGMHEPPSVYGPELGELAATSADGATRHMRSLLDAAGDAGMLRDMVDRDVLADRLCQSMLHIGIGVFHRHERAEVIPRLKMRVLLNGLAGRALDSPESEARQIAARAASRWTETPTEDDRDHHIASAARAEFARRGFAATTVRDVAAAAGVSAKALYRLAGSKDMLLVMVLEDYLGHLVGSWDDILESGSTAAEKLDALAWLNIRIFERFGEEHKIQSAYLQANPPADSSMDYSFPRHLSALQAVLAQATEDGVITIGAPPDDLLARCVFALIWTPEPIVRRLGPDGAFVVAQETLFRGAATGG